nr:helix-hairpin-helix domain-containing protein [uncultured Desulfobacter sp.]
MDAKKLTAVITSICALLFLGLGSAYAANSTNSTTKKEVVTVKEKTKSTDKKIKSTKKEVKTSVTNKTKSSTGTAVKKTSVNNKISTQKGSSSKKVTTADNKVKTNNTLSKNNGILENNKKGISSTSKKQSSSLTKKFSGRVNINKGTAEDLQQISGIGPVKAKSIIDYRKKHGSFKSAQDLLNVKGIGKGTVDKIKQYLVF